MSPPRLFDFKDRRFRWSCWRPARRGIGRVIVLDASRRTDEIPTVTIDHAIDRLYALKVDTTTRDGDGWQISLSGPTPTGLRIPARG